MSKNKNRQIYTKDSDQVDYYGRILEWFRRNRVLSLFMFLAVLVIGVWKFYESFFNLYTQLKIHTTGSPIKIAGVLYLSETAVDPTTQISEAYREIRDLSNNCRVIHIGLVSPSSKQRFTLTKGAEAQAELKFKVLNTSRQRLTGVRLVLAKIPLDFKRLTTTPNIIAEMSRPNTSGGGELPHVIQIKELNSNDYAVITLIAPLNRKNFSDVFKIKYPLNIQIVSMSSDQLPIIKDIRNDVINADDLIMEESMKTTGNPINFGISITPFSANEFYHKNDYPILPLARDCPDENYKTIIWGSQHIVPKAVFVVKEKTSLPLKAEN